MAIGVLMDNYRSMDFASLDDIEEAIKKDELVIYLQPQVNTVNGKITGAEALVRWLQPDSSVGTLFTLYFQPAPEPD